MRASMLCLVLSVPSLLFAQEDAVRQVLAVKAGIGPAMRQKNAAALENIWSPDMKVNAPGNRIQDRASVLKDLGEGKIGYSSYRDTLESSSSFKDLVILMGHEDLVEAAGPDAGKQKTRRYTDVWQRNNAGAWMLIARQATYTTAP